MPKRDEQSPGRTHDPQPEGDDMGVPDTERQRAPGDRDVEEEDEGLE
jgi:hypothetical protein